MFCTSDKPESKLLRSSVLKSFATVSVLFKSFPTASTAASPVVVVGATGVVNVLAVCWHAIRNIKNNDKIISAILFFMLSPVSSEYCVNI